MLHMSVALSHLNGFVPGSLIARSSVPVLSKPHSMCTIHYLHRLYCNFVCRPRWPRVFRKAGPATALPYHRQPFGRYVGIMLASIRPLRGLMFELFRGARLLLLACCLSIAGALFLLRPLLLSFEAHMPVSDAGPLHRGILGRSSNGLHWFEGTPSFRRRGRLREATPTRRHQRRRSCETECPTST